VDPTGHEDIGCPEHISVCEEDELENLYYQIIEDSRNISEGTAGSSGDGSSPNPRAIAPAIRNME
jgi:hypothetical protein